MLKFNTLAHKLQWISLLIYAFALSRYVMKNVNICKIRIASIKKQALSILLEIHILKINYTHIYIRMYRPIFVIDTSRDLTPTVL
jgi:hypothetical protein